MEIINRIKKEKADVVNYGISFFLFKNYPVNCRVLHTFIMMKLLPENELIWSPIVANNRMNRKRKASGINSYEKELKFKPETFLNACLEQQEHVNWLDLCCGEGNALLQYAGECAGKGLQHRVTLSGIDLVDEFQNIPPSVSCLKFETGSLVNWEYNDQYDLVTCIHGLHYIGDKLEALRKVLRVIKGHGLFIANLDLGNIRIDEDQKSQFLKNIFIENQIAYNDRRKLISCKGPRDINFRLVYKGADEKTGPNYTGQDVVDSYYSLG